ncbi:MAG: hypothetical protein ACI9S8_002025 [Chlamydiales bacterium]|jgi:hypothetical protein
MTFFKNSLPIAACLLCLSCGWTHISKEESPVKTPEPYAAAPSPIPRSPSWTTVQKALRELPPNIQNKLCSSFFETTDALEKDPNNNSLLSDLHRQLRKKPWELPVISDVIIPLRYKSKFDSHDTQYTIRAPKNSASAKGIFIFLGTEPQSEIPLSSYNVWTIHIPSRPLMNYQLLAEGDFWKLLEDLSTLYPQIRNIPHFLVGSGEAADAALLIANNYRGHFKGVAFDNSRLALNLPNLDKLPIVLFSNEHSTPTSSPWGGIHLISRLQDRGNSQAVAVTGNLEDAANHLLNHTKNEAGIPSFVFEDYQYVQLTPWLKVIGKRSEKDPVKLAVTIQNEALYIKAPNVNALELSLSKEEGFPENIKEIHFNRKVFSLAPSSGNPKLFLEDFAYPTWRRKADSPGGLVNFFRNDPLYVVFQDGFASEEYLQYAKELASQLASLDFFGFPDLGVELPMVPLSLYDPENLPLHRTIVIGQAEIIRPILEDTTGYLPIRFTEKGIKVFDELYTTPSPPANNVAFGMIYPPQQISSLRLALLLAAEDIGGLQAIAKRFTSATSLYDDSDLVIWYNQGDEYVLTAEETFNGFWQSSESSELLIQTPPHSRNIWESYLHELLIEECQLSKIAITPCTDEFIEIPYRLTHHSLSLMIPEKHFAVVKLQGIIGHKIGNKLIAAMDDPALIGLDNVITVNWSSSQASVQFNKMNRNDNFRMVVDASALEALSQEELKILDYRILPYSLREIVLSKITTDKERFGRSFLRLANLMEQE